MIVGCRVLAVVVVSLLAASASAPAQGTSQPASAPSNEQRLTDLIALIEGQNPPEVRRTIARELLLNGWPETPPRVVVLLGGSNGPAKVAVAAALAELPQFLTAAYVEPLMVMLADEDAEVRAAAAGTLAAYQNSGVIPRLRKLIHDDEQPESLRISAIAALGLMTRRSAIDGLAELLPKAEPAIARAALAALEQATAVDFNNDSKAAYAWWEESRTLSLEAWQQKQIERLVRKDRTARRELEAIETRLVKLLGDNFRRAPDAERIALLGSFLADGSTPIQLLGMKLTQLHLAEGKAQPEELPEELRSRIRKLMHSPEPDVQAEAVRTVVGFRAPQDGGGFLEMLGKVRPGEVRQALINGLGYVGTQAAVQPLLNVLGQDNEQCVTEAVTALGRLAERGVLSESNRPLVAAGLVQVFEKTTPTQVALRERVLWAMGIVKDAQFGPCFAAALNRSEAVAVRQAATRGIASLADPQLADALIGATSDPDGAVRKAAIDTLATLGSSDQHLDALWQRMAPPVEHVEVIRQAAARAALELLVKRSAEQIEARLAHLPANGPERGPRMLDFLARLAKRLQEAEPSARDRLGVVHARIAALHAELGQLDQAIAAYLVALADLHAAKSGPATRVALELLHLALVNGRYDQNVASALAAGNPGPSGEALWQAVAAVIEARLTPDDVDQALALLDALEKHPPGPLPSEALQALRARAQQIKHPPPPEPTPQSQPSSAPTSQPAA